MADSPDAVVLVPPPGRRWSSPGGHEDDESITLYVGTGATDGSPSRGYEVRIPLEVDADGTLRVGEPEATEVER